MTQKNKPKEQAVEIFELVVKNKMLPDKLEKLVPLSFIGVSAVKFYREQLKLMDQLEMAEEQRKATLENGQQAGEMLLDIEVRIGEIALNEPSAITAKRGKGVGPGSIPSGKPPKHERLGLRREKMHQAQTLAKNKDIVKRIKKKAKENEDIATKTAALSEIKYEKEKKRRKAAEGKKKKSRVQESIEAQKYLLILTKIIRLLPHEPPKTWTDAGLQEAKEYATVISSRLEELL